MVKVSVSCSSCGSVDIDVSAPGAEGIRAKWGRELEELEGRAAELDVLSIAIGAPDGAEPTEVRRLALEARAAASRVPELEAKIAKLEEEHGEALATIAGKEAAMTVLQREHDEQRREWEAETARLLDDPRLR